jgi:hypothetical protein
MDKKCERVGASVAAMLLGCTTPNVYRLVAERKLKRRAGTNGQVFDLPEVLALRAQRAARTGLYGRRRGRMTTRETIALRIAELKVGV